MGVKIRKEWMEKTIRLTLLPSRKKQKYLRDAQEKVIDFANTLIPFKRRVKTRKEFHHLVYYRFKYLGFHSQLQENIQRRVYATKKVRKFTQFPLEFNFPRSGKLAQTERGNPVLSLSPLKERIAIPILQDGGWRRLKEYEHRGWEAHSCRVFYHRRKKKWVVHLNIRKELPPPSQEIEGTIGVDVGRKVVAAITLTHPSFPLIERYLGKDIVWKQYQFVKRRRKLRSYKDKGSKKARRALKRLKMKEKNYNQTPCEQIAHEIVDLALTTRSAIVIENIKGIKKKWRKSHSYGSKSEKKTKKVKKLHSIRRELNSWSYSYFLSFLTSLAQQNRIPAITVDPHYTSQTCSRCGRISKKSRVTRGLYRCVSCGFEVNSDRNASRNISWKGLSSLGLSFYSSWSSSFSSFSSSSFSFPRERKNFLFPVSVVEERSTFSNGSMTGPGSSIPRP
ncbi:MAG: transposase [Candidatus Heimdallarchaeum aukensis]|uniref:Transposase n=1 Tax=Candidatus Heimdallarchaeum aukensis TaxID=2876573 RepID=A0A9Y1BK28_9ARCH|nr:MAG: transposase [Candidatus Heimdallarchaeum aukensis]